MFFCHAAFTSMVPVPCSEMGPGDLIELAFVANPSLASTEALDGSCRDIISSCSSASVTGIRARA